MHVHEVFIFLYTWRCENNFSDSPLHLYMSAGIGFKSPGLCGKHLHPLSPFGFIFFDVFFTFSSNPTFLLSFVEFTFFVFTRFCFVLFFSERIIKTLSLLFHRYIIFSKIFGHIINNGIRFLSLLSRGHVFLNFLVSLF